MQHNGGPREDLSGLKITIFSADIDVHHTELFFYNYFRLLAGTGAVTWRTLPYEGATPGDVAASDLVVFVRPRFLEVPALLQACRAQGNPSLVTLDDNWIAAGKEYSRFAALFTPGKPSFEIFINFLQRADAVLVFSRVLEEEIQPWANKSFACRPTLIFLGLLHGRRSARPGSWWGLRVPAQIRRTRVFRAFAGSCFDIRMFGC